MLLPFVWSHGWAVTVDASEDARSAVAVLASWGGTPPPFVPGTGLGGDIGRTYALAGDDATAVIRLRLAAGACNAIEQPIAQTRARYWLGRALEDAGDRPGACDAYRRVNERWGSARPRSITARDALARASKLACGPRP
jgi:hypothetical protein